MAIERGDVPSLCTIKAIEARLLNESDRQKKVSKGRGKKDRTALHSWINGKSFSGFSGKVGVRKIAEKIEAEIIRSKPNGIGQASASAIERLMKGAKTTWSQSGESHSIKVALSHLSQ